MPRWKPLAAAALLAACLPLVAGAQPTAQCSARSPAVAPRVVELYTSEGCNSCPPADAWLGTLKDRADVLPLAFHVDYWDRLGWTDRFASAAWTRRQHDSIATSGARFAYTPQVLVDGRDDRRWPRLPAANGRPAPVGLALERDGRAYRLTVLQAAAEAAWSGYWVVTEDGHATQVRAGENAGVRLQHDAVVRELQRIDRLPAAGAAALRFTPRAPDAISQGASARKLHFVVTDPKTGAPVQAVSLGC